MFVPFLKRLQRRDDVGASESWQQSGRENGDYEKVFCSGDTEDPMMPMHTSSREYVKVFYKLITFLFKLFKCDNIIIS